MSSLCAISLGLDNVRSCNMLCTVFNSGIATSSFGGESAEVRFQDRHESHLGRTSEDSSSG
ncbi:hypothetical protein MtrunA17_Chr1g0191131 [Medicago truncatula]|uniref:Uncharacterized protein n=1 Tax=Medicago truncatula TaxID=3880 RepID=A0A396JT39_MEDTR|nr:hypothetical protein MtrunA17_Chr1g0191131 [Medicago truncatula]